MKEFVIFRLSLDGYGSGKFSSDIMCDLGSFFSTDYRLYGYDFLIEWANDPEQDGTNANITYLEKKDGMVSIGDLLYDEEPFETFDLTIEQFTKLLNDWERVTTQKFKEIVITKDGSKITVEGKNEFSTPPRIVERRKK